MSEPLIFERSVPGRRGLRFPAADVPEEAMTGLPLRRRPPALPEVAELDAVRHFTRLSADNYAIDKGFYPLGSCTMKYNPKINDQAAALPGFADLHPFAPASAAQGALELLWRLERALCEIAGMARFTLQPAAGAHGELTGMLIVRAYHRDRGEDGRRRKVLVPDSAHGTNPATAATLGYEVVEVPSDARGGVDLAALRAACDDGVAALMLTNPNTLGLFDENILAIAEAVHGCGGLLYYDGANANAIVGRVRPGDMGFDIVHFNLHKTFSTPHGMGGPGAGPVGVVESLVPYLPVPLVDRGPDGFTLRWDLPRTIGRVRAGYGNFGVLVRAFAYILSNGRDGLEAVSGHAVLNANYLLALLGELFDVPYPRRCMHEFVVAARSLKARTGVRAYDVAKALLDRGFHAPTVYFPLVVEEALMVEPTETEAKETLDAFAAALRDIVAAAERDPASLAAAPRTTPVGRMDEAAAARRPVVRWTPAAAD
jgi:glycine dehydrogenase subunit 2